MADERTIPILPCHSIHDILTFYTALGFEITYQQTKPNTYACVRRGGIDLHFFSMRGYEPKDSYSTCVVVVPDVAALYQEFAGRLRQQYGRLPVAGIPRLTRLRDKGDGGQGFNIIDPGGNWIRISQGIDTVQAQEPADSSKLSRAVMTAEMLADSKGDAAAAAKLLDKALAWDDPAPIDHRVHALVVRANVALAMDDPQLARTILAAIRQLPLEQVEADDHAALTANLQRAADLEQMLL